MLSSSLHNEITTLLSSHWQTPITIELIDELESQYIVTRCRVTGDHPDLPLNIIIKKWELRDEPSEFQVAPSMERFHREHDTLQFLSSVFADQPLAPRCLASSRTTGLLIVEDLGDNPTVQDILFEDETTQAQALLKQLASQLAHLHGGTLGHETEFNATTQNAPAMPIDATLNLHTAELNERLQESLTGMNAPPIDDTILAELEAILHNPTDFRVLTHCDAGVHNFLAVGESVRIMDFEFARYANGFIDLACLRLGFPVAFRARRIPATILDEVESAYRTILAEYYPSAQDDAWFGQMLSAACTHWALVWMMNIWRGYLVHRLSAGEIYDTEEQRSPEIMALFRQKCLTYLTVALDTADTYQCRTSLHDSMSIWRDTFLQHFPKTELLPYYPVFQD